MRPSTSEQLAGIRSILTNVVCPQIEDPYTLGILSGLLASLDSLADGWREVPRFLWWDSQETCSVVSAALPFLDQELTDEFNRVVAEAPVDRLDVAALEDYHRRVRRVLERAVPAIVEEPDIRALWVSHIRERIGRFPIATTPSTPEK